MIITEKFRNAETPKDRRGASCRLSAEWYCYASAIDRLGGARRQHVLDDKVCMADTLCVSVSHLNFSLPRSSSLLLHLRVRFSDLTTLVLALLNSSSDVDSHGLSASLLRECMLPTSSHSRYVAALCERQGDQTLTLRTFIFN